VTHALQEVTNIFSAGGGEKLAQSWQVPFLGVFSCVLPAAHGLMLSSTGRIPIEPRLTAALEQGLSFMNAFEDSAARDALLGVCDALQALPPRPA
jgi:hypothetical protein